MPVAPQRSRNIIFWASDYLTQRELYCLELFVFCTMVFLVIAPWILWIGKQG